MYYLVPVPLQCISSYLLVLHHHGLVRLPLAAVPAGIRLKGHEHPAELQRRRHPAGLPAPPAARNLHRHQFRPSRRRGDECAQPDFCREQRADQGMDGDDDRLAFKPSTKITCFVKSLLLNHSHLPVYDNAPRHPSEEHGGGDQHSLRCVRRRSPGVG